MRQVNGAYMIPDAVVAQQLIPAEPFRAEGDDASWRLKMVVVIKSGEVRFVIDLPVEFGEELVIVPAAGTGSGVSVDDVQRVGDPLQINRIGGCGGGLCL